MADEFLDIDDPFVTCLYDAPHVAVWLHADQAAAAVAVLDLATTDGLPAPVLLDALAVVPEGAIVKCQVG